MKKKINLILLILTLFLLSVQNSISVPNKSGEPIFSDITISNSDSHLLLYGMLDDAFTDEMIQGLHSGLPIHFSFFVELNPTSKGWKNGVQISLETHHIVTYDTLKETYKVEIEESGKRFFSYSRLKDAQQAANEINGLKLVKFSELSHDTSYTIRIRAELHKKTLPMGLHEVVPFVSWWDLKTQMVFHNL